MDLGRKCVKGDASHVAPIGPPVRLQIWLCVWGFGCVCGGGRLGAKNTEKGGGEYSATTLPA